MKNVFEALKSILLPYSKSLEIKHDDQRKFLLNTHHVMKYRKPLFFGAAEIKKNYVSYHLMPVYVNPELLKETSPALRRHVQGKSCFGFTSVNEARSNQ